MVGVGGGIRGGVSDRGCRGFGFGVVWCTLQRVVGMEGCRVVGNGPGCAVLEVELMGNFEVLLD